MKKKFFLFSILSFQFSVFNLSFSQQKRGFQAGLYAGAYFANQTTAVLYDGYGYDLGGIKNNFDNSWLVRKINYEYGGGNYQPDRIAPALGLANSNEWKRITPENMPINMRYTPAFAIGLNARYNVNKKSSLLFNFNTMRLSCTGNFTIEVTPSANQAGNTWATQTIRTFPILGKEQRFAFQIGLQQFFTENKIFNFFAEAGPSLNYVKFVNNHVVINTLDIDLTTQYDVAGNRIFRARNMTSVDFGFFAGVGLNLNTQSNWMVQMVYNPSLERFGIGENPGPFFQNNIGLRMFKMKNSEEDGEKN